MSNKRMHHSVLALFLALILYACHTQRNLQTEKPIRFLSTNKIIDSVMLKRLTFEYFSSKLSVDIESEKLNESFGVSLRIRKDSIIWMDVKKASISVARVAITRDSIKLLVRFGDGEGYYPRSFNFINDQFETQLDFTMLQDLLIANAMSFDKDEKYKSPADSGFYYLTTLKKRKLRKALEHDRVYKKHPVVYQYKFYPKNFRPYQVWINDLNDTTVLDVRYSEYEGLDSIPLPKQVEVEASKAAKKMKLKLAYKRTKLNEKTDYPFTIPDGYKKL